MHTADPPYGVAHPARRQGEANYREGANMVLPVNAARRAGEPHHQAWKKFRQLNLVADMPSASAGGLLSVLAQDRALMQTAENSVVMLGALTNSLAALHGILQSMPDLADIVAVLAQNGRGNANAGANGANGANGAENAPSPIPVSPIAQGGDWTPERAVEFHNICSETRRSQKGNARETARYQSRPRDEDGQQILPPLRRYRPRPE